MRTHKLFSRFGLAMVAILLLSSMQHVYAAGTLAGTTITNVASVQYNAGINVRNGTSNITTMVVGYKVVINLSPSSSSTTTVDSTSIYKAYTVTNSGNYADSLQFAVTRLPAGWIDTVFFDRDGSGIEKPADSVITGAGGFWTAQDASHAILLKITIPGYGQAPDNMIDSVTVTTASYGSGPGAVVRVGGNGLQKYQAHVTIAQPVLTVTGAQTVTGSPAIPGSAFAYTLTLKNSGHAAIQSGATLSFISDTNFHFTSATNGGTNGSVNGSGNGGTVTWTLNSTDLPALMAAPLTETVNLTIQQVTNNGTGATAGNTITIMDSTATQKTTTHLVFNDGTNTHTIGTTKLTQFTVAQASGAYLAITTSALNGNPGDSLTYTFTLRNGGNATNTFNLTQVKSGGNYDTVHVFHLTMGGPSITNTGSVPAGSTITLYVGLYVNVTGVNDSTIIRLLTASPTAVGAGTPLGAGNYNASITVTTTVTAPNLSIVLSQSYISGVGTITNPAPGDVIEYTLTITNSGLGTATNLSTSNVIPTNTTFLPNAYAAGKGIMIGGVAQTNAADGDNGSFVGSTVSASSLTVAGSGGSVAIKYQVSVN